MKKALNMILLCAFILALIGIMGCTEMLMVKHTEPPVIIARNSTGIHLERVTVSSAPDATGRSTRFGTISPVPKGASQVFVRPTDPARLPETVLIEWIDTQGNKYYRHLSLKDALKASTGSKGEALVFEFGQGGDIVVYIEN